MAASLAPLRARLPRAVGEREILRVAATISGDDPLAAMVSTRREILAWAQRRSGGRLPTGAWDGQSFEYMPGGRTTLGARVRKGDADLWALRNDDPDKTVPGRVWTTEVTIGRGGDDAPQLSLRLLVSSPEDELDIEPHIPGLLQQVSEQHGLWVGSYEVKPEAWCIRSQDDVSDLITMLESRGREIPVIIASGDERAADPDQPLIDVPTLARATLGLAHVVVLPARLTYGLSDVFGKLRSVFHGAIRVYMPGFDAASDPYSHRLVLADVVRRDPAACVRDLRWRVATESLSRTRLGHNILPFSAVRSAALQVEQEAKADARATDSDRLASAWKGIEALKAELQEAQNQVVLSLEEAVSFEARAKSAEAQLFGARARIQQLEQQLQARGYGPDTDLQLPETWPVFSDWCDQALIGRLVLVPSARSEIRKAVFNDIAQAARCLIWLAGTCRDRRMNGGGSLANIPIVRGVENAPCGADSFTFDFHGRSLEADWHVKSGGNTRDPNRCMRIYYAWDEPTQQIVVAAMPAHRRTGAT